MADVAADGKSGKVVIRNIGLMLSGDIDHPILDADTVVVMDGIITAVGREKDCDTAQPDSLIDACGTCLANHIGYDRRPSIQNSNHGS